LKQQHPINIMPPRRVLPIRSRVDGSPSHQRAGDGDGSTAAPVISAGGSSVDAASVHRETPALKGENSTHVDKAKAGDEGKAAVEANGLKDSGNCPDKQAHPKPCGLGRHEIMVSTYAPWVTLKSIAIDGGLCLTCEIGVLM
jgi:hypothetical protein